MAQGRAHGPAAEATRHQAHKTASNDNSKQRQQQQHNSASRAAVVGSRRAIGHRNRQPPCTEAAATAQHNSKSNQGTGKASNSTHSTKQKQSFQTVHMQEAAPRP